MKRIFITESQLKETLKLKETINMAVDKKPGQDLDAAARDALTQAKKDAPSADVNLVVSSDELTEDANSGISVSEQVVDFILNNYEDITCDSTISEIKNAIQDAYIECFGEEMEYDNNSLYSEIINLLMNRLCSSVNESVIVFTKKQIKEAKKAKRIQESKVLTKGEILKSVK